MSTIGARQKIELRVAIAFGPAPLGVDPALLFELVQGSVERTVAHLQNVPGTCLRRWLMARPLSGSSARIFKRIRSSVPWSKSFGLLIDPPPRASGEFIQTVFRITLNHSVSIGRQIRLRRTYPANGFLAVGGWVWFRLALQSTKKPYCALSVAGSRSLCLWHISLPSIAERAGSYRSRRGKANLIHGENRRARTFEKLSFSKQHCSPVASLRNTRQCRDC